MLTLTIDRSDEQPVYEQVADQLRRLVSADELAPGTALPSVRQLARDLGVNLNTIARAYRLLEAEGFLVIRDRAGVTVAAPSKEVDHGARNKLFEQLRVTLARLRQTGVTAGELMEAVRCEVDALGTWPGEEQSHD